ncbi:MAG: M55 family metallopeptidase [Synergistales bacterium]|nr:M55 family metallopeptidase [Synergistales bacterium]
MKIYISLDMEGATGVVHPDQVTPGKEGYSFGRAMQMHDLLAAVEGAKIAGATEILVNDAHDRMTNLDVREFDVDITLISGSPKKLGMMEGLEGSDGVFLIAYHAMAGTAQAVMDHSLSTSAYEIRLNGKPAGEVGLNAALCAHYGIPVILVTGDQAVCSEAEQLLEDRVITCPVKTGRGQFCGDLLSPGETGKKISLGAREAVQGLQKGLFDILDIVTPYRLDITFQYTSQCDACATMPCCERTGGRTVTFEGDDLVEMRRWASVALDMADTIPKW